MECCVEASPPGPRAGAVAAAEAQGPGGLTSTQHSMLAVKYANSAVNYAESAVNNPKKPD